MSENLHNIDDLFKKAIDDHVDTPSQKVWDTIDKNLDKKKVVSISRKYNKLKWAAAILLLFSAGMAMYVWQTRLKNKELVKQNDLNKSSRSIKENNNTDGKNPTSDSNEKIINPKNKNESQTEDHLNSTQSQTATHTDKQLDQSQTQTIPDTDVQKIRQTNSSRHTITAIEKEKAEKQQITNRDEKKTDQFDNNKKQNNNESVTQGEIKTKAPENNITTAEKEKYIVDAPMVFTQQPNMNGILEIRSSYPFSYQPEIPSTDKNVPVANNNKRSSSKKIASGTSPFSATLFFSPEFVSSDVKDDHPRFREDDRNEIKNHENTRSSSSYGILFDYKVGGNWKLESGASVSTRVTDINTKTIYARPDNSGKVNYRLSCSAGSVYVPLKSGASPTQGDSTKILSAKNTLQYVSVPLVIKYSIGKGKIKLVPGIGISANILSKGKVETVIATTGGNESSSTNNIDGLKSNYFSGQVSLGGEYLISKKIALNFTPTARLALSSINKDAAVRTKFNSLGFSAGITVKF